MIKFIEHGGRCRPTMDYVPGELLIYRLKRCPEAEKELVFDWMRELLRQIELYHRCRGNQCYRYVNPFSVLVTRENKILLLDLEAESNEFVLRNMQKRAMRNHFVKPIIHIRENTKITLDLYGYGKTIQFILANTNVEPSLTKREENRLEKIIQKCLGENPKKQYEDLKQVQKELPTISNWNQRKRKTWVIVIAGLAATAVILAVSAVRIRGKQEEKIQMQQGLQNIKEESQMAETAENEGGTGNHTTDGGENRLEPETADGVSGLSDGMDQLEEDIDGLQEYLLKNTTKDNQEIIEQGEKLQRELLRYLAAAYDREGMAEKAAAAYEALCEVETQTELLKTTYLRRISLAMEQQDEGKAVRIGEEAIERFPELKETDIFKTLEELYGLTEKETVYEEEKNAEEKGETDETEKNANPAG